MQTGQLKGERIPTTIRREVPKEPQSTLFGICMVLAGIALVAFLAALGNFAFQEYKLEIGVLLAISFLGAMILAAGGLNKEEVNTSFREKRPSDLMPEFILRRRRSWATAELLARTEDAATGLAKSLEALQGPGQQSQRNRSQREFPFSPEVCAILLDHRHITAGESLREFWRHHPASILWDPAEPLLEALVNHAREQCAPFASVTWAELFRILGERKVEGQVLREVVERAQRRSLPWMRIPGFASQVFLALPQELPDQMQKALRDEFPAPKTVVETPGSGLVVLHLTQGYRQPDAQSDSP